MAEDKGAKKLAGKYATPEELEAAYAELEKKLGTQGTQLGTLQQQVEQAQAALGQYAEYVKQADPIVKWYAQNEAGVRAWAETHAAGGGAGGARTGAVRQQAADLAQQTPGYEWLSAEEKKGLVTEITTALQQQVVKPWITQFETAANQYAANLANQHKAFTDVIWKSFEHALPEDKVKALRAWHEESLRFADPSKLDPMKTAQDWMSLRADNERLKAQNDEFTKKAEQTMKDEVPSLFGGTPPQNGTAPDAPKNRDERYQRVMGDLKQEHGAAGAAVLFPSLGG